MNILAMKNKIFLTVITVFLVLVILGFWKHDLLCQTVWDFLVVNEKPQPADVIIVLSGGEGRVEQAVRLYQGGYAPKIILSGDRYHTLEKRAIALGVPVKDILVDLNSNTTFGNAYYSAEIMRTEDFKSAIIVTSAYHTRRAGIIFGHFFQEWKLTICAAPYDTSLSADWWKNRLSFVHVVGEYLKLIYLYLVELPVQKVFSILNCFGFNLPDPLY
jgi:uncharacterized SAM-binding protein YcdF (DUF218 family)